MNTITLSTKISILSYFSIMMQDGMTLSLLEHPSFNLSFFTSVGLQAPFISFMEVANSLELAVRDNLSELIDSEKVVCNKLKSTGELMIEFDQVEDTLMEKVISTLQTINTISG